MRSRFWAPLVADRPRVPVLEDVLPGEEAVVLELPAEPVAEVAAPAPRMLGAYARRARAARRG